MCLNMWVSLSEMRDEEDKWMKYKVLNVRTHNLLHWHCSIIFFLPPQGVKKTNFDINIGCNINKMD